MKDNQALVGFEGQQMHLNTRNDTSILRKSMAATDAIQVGITWETLTKFILQFRVLKINYSVHLVNYPLSRYCTM